MIGNMTYGNDAISRDLGQVIYRMKMLGFNAIRLPFTFAGLAEVRSRMRESSTFGLPAVAQRPKHCAAAAQSPVSYTEQCDVPSAANIEATVVPPSLPSGLKSSGLSAPPQTPPQVPDDMCNKFLPNDSTESRYIWVIRCALLLSAWWRLAAAHDDPGRH